MCVCVRARVCVCVRARACVTLDRELYIGQLVAVEEESFQS